MSDDLTKFHERLLAIEKALDGLSKRPTATDLTVEELATFKKVRDVLAFDPDSVCGINECFKGVSVCRVCQICQSICRVCKVCDFECVCGPCGLGSRGGRFGGLGE